MIDIYTHIGRLGENKKDELSIKELLKRMDEWGVERSVIHIFRWPGGVATIPGIKNDVLSAKILTTGKKVKFEKKDNGLLILKRLPKNSPDKYDTVIKVELEGRPEAFKYEGSPL